MKRIAIDHVTEYQFAGRVSLQPHRLMLRPREERNVRIESVELNIEPAHHLRWTRDALDNSVALVTFEEPSGRLCIESRLIVHHGGDNPFDFMVDDYAVSCPFDYLSTDLADLVPFRLSVFPSEVESVRSWLSDSGLNGESDTFSLLDRLNREISARFVYRVRDEEGVQTPVRTIACGSGSCRDLATLYMESCRMLGLASRFVSGYVYTPDSIPGAGATHAWAEVYLPGAGWIGFDPAAGEVVGNRHVAVAVARHPESIPPVSGSYIGVAGERPSLSVAVRVESVDA